MIRKNKFRLKKLDIYLYKCNKKNFVCEGKRNNWFRLKNILIRERIVFLGVGKVEQINLGKKKMKNVT